MLRRIVGDEDFFDIVRTYGERHGEPSSDPVVSDDFISVVHEISGLSLDDFFTQWLYHPGRPHYQWDWGSVKTDDGYDIEIRISQIQSGYDAFWMPIDIIVQTTGGNVPFVIENTAREQTFTLHVDDRPTDLLFDPDSWILKTVVPRGGAISRPLLQAPAPNPSRGSSQIQYDLANATNVTLRIYDLGGRLVRTLIDGVEQDQGQIVTWDGHNDRGWSVPSGVYFVRLETTCCEVRTRLVMIR
jgi:hypothetical protein